MSEQPKNQKSSTSWVTVGAILLVGYLIVEQLQVSDNLDPYAKCETLQVKIFGNRIQCRGEIAVRRLSGEPY